MIPIEVANIASILRDWYECEGSSSEDEFDYSVQVAWEIYNAINKDK